MSKKNLKFLVGGLLIVAVIAGVLISVGSENMTYYYTPAEVLATPADFADQRIRVMGLVEKGTIRFNPQETLLTFNISDDSGKVLLVNYQGALPDMFREGQGVVVEGRLQGDGTLKASVLLVKHNEEYKVSGHGEDRESYIKTLAL